MTTKAATTIAPESEAGPAPIGPPTASPRGPQGRVVAAGFALDRQEVAGFLGRLDAVMREKPDRIVIDLGEVERFDSAGIGALVEAMRRVRERGGDVRLRGMSQAMLDFCSLLSVERLLEGGGKAERLDPISRLGASVLPLFAGLRGIFEIGGQALHGLFVAPFRGKRLRIDRAIGELDEAANGALPIVVLIAFLLGMTLAMQAWVQLRTWGAETYVADMVGVSVMTEIGPLMTAIVLAARSGSSNAAQLGAMVVGEEIDALVQMGVHPIRFLVVPKVLAMAVAMVALTLLFDVVGICAGAVFAHVVGGIELAAYRGQTALALMPGDFLVATLKSLAFGLCVGIVGCALGLRVRGGSEGVGRATTNAVVVSIFMIICIDALFVTAQRMVLGG
jgi:phospholipid/cholesterol/gamma-HCH transport system permease protein